MTVAGGLAAEDRLLLECCRVEVSADGAQRAASLIASGLDWDSVLEASIRHAVSPLLKWGLDQVARAEAIDGLVPPAVFHDLDVLYRGSAQRNRRLYAALAEIVAGLRPAGVEAVGLKDVQLAVEIYPEPALRPMGDIDLLILEEDYDAVARALARLGYRPRPGADVPYTRKYALGQHFRRPSDDVWIDVQWNVMQREWDVCGEGSFTYDGAGMWHDAVPMQRAGFELRAPALEDMLFHLCLHLEGHGYGELVLFCDIAELIRQQGNVLDWNRVLEIARGYGAESSVYYVLLLTERLLGAAIPAEVMRSLEPAFFHGGLLEPLFGNLMSLHLTLDEIRLAALPPQSVLDGYERVSRRQAARAMRLDRELRGLATSFVSSGGRVITFHGAPSPRLFPDPSLPAFEPLHVFVLDQDLPVLEETLRGSGFAASADGLGYRAVFDVVSADPVLAGRRVFLAVDVDISSDLSAFFADDAAPQTNVRSAVRSLRDRAAGSEPDDETAQAKLVVHPLGPEDLVVWVAAIAGRADADRLFRLTGLVEVLRRVPRPVDAERLRKRARHHGVEREAAVGLRAVRALEADAPSIEAVEALITAPRILEWARYGPSSVTRYPWLRPAYYFALSMFSAKGATAKLAYLGRSIVGIRRPHALLPSLALNVAAAALRSFVRPQRAIRDFAYWVEPETAKQLSASSRAADSGETGS